jgi:hypothetical protein
MKVTPTVTLTVDIESHDLNSMYPSVLNMSTKSLKVNWDFKHHPTRQYKWEAYYSPQDPSTWGELYRWCRETFGDEGGRWDSHGGWIKFRERADVDWFLMRWL